MLDFIPGFYLYEIMTMLFYWFNFAHMKRRSYHKLEKRNCAHGKRGQNQIYIAKAVVAVYEQYQVRPLNTCTVRICLKAHQDQ